ncbi:MULTISPECIES: phage major capsid protein [Streptomyces]|uniref:Phage capsid protein n=2 Tax=Streptomyces TaxID=1883 RepID=A0A117IW31_9ACTN|nr:MULTISPECIES: phage major capsid protein [Streptomyces]KUH38390.1 phage capsid protein [Streptomyces kanasensis]UUS30835.1 phage major capsid protein [Streptomyces changanensis]
MPTLQTLLDQRASAWAKAQEFQNRAATEADMPAEDRSAWDAALADVERLSADIEREERHVRLSAVDYSQVVTASADTEDAEEARARHGGEDGVKAYESAYRSWLREGTSDLTSEERSVLRTGWVDGRELRAQGVATGAAGGYLVPPAFRARLVEAQKFYGAMRDVAEVITTETGATLPWPTADDTANVGAILSENTQVTEQDVTIGQADIGAYTYTSKLVRVSLQLLQDNAFDLESWLARKLGERIGRIQNTHFTTGTGTSQPEGVQTNATVGKTGTTGQTTSVTYDDLIDLIHSIDPAYRNSGRQRFMFNDATLAAVRKLKDSQGRPLWEPSIQVGVPDGILGYSYTVNQDMPVMAANAKSILFGDFFAGYLIRDVRDVQLLRLSERYADYLQVGFLAFSRADGTPQDTAAYKAYRNSAT